MIGIASCAKAPVPSPPVAQIRATDNDKEKTQEKIIDDGAFPKNVQIEDHPDDKPTSRVTVLVDDVGKYLKQPDAPVRKGRVTFTTDGPLKVKQGETWIEAKCSGGVNGFRLGYVLTGKIKDGKLDKKEFEIGDLAQIEIRYTDALLEAKGLTENDVPGLIEQLYKPENTVRFYGTVIPGGEMLYFSEPMEKLIILGEKARQPLVNRLGDQRIRNEVALILGAIGDEATVPALIAVYPGIDAQAEKNAGKVKYEENLRIICMTFSLTYLTGQPIGRSRYGADCNPENQKRWKEWWESEKATFKVPIIKPNHTWVPSYPILTEAWAKKCKEWFIKAAE
jgi:hypothetical protein